VYDLVTRCFNDTTHYPEFSILKKHRQLLRESTENIEVTDFGAGSRVFKSNQRSISAIAKNAGVPKKRQQLLLRLSRYFQPTHSLELGTSLGLGSIALALGNPNGTLHTVEGCPETARVASTFFDKFELNNITLHQKTFEGFFGSDAHHYDLVYVDGNHNKERTLNYFDILLERVHNDSVIIFDDIYWSPEMTEAWQLIREHPKVKVSVDTFQWGLICFRKEQEKEHFNIRL